MQFALLWACQLVTPPVREVPVILLGHTDTMLIASNAHAVSTSKPHVKLQMGFSQFPEPLLNQRCLCRHSCLSCLVQVCLESV